MNTKKFFAAICSAIFFASTFTAHAEPANKNSADKKISAPVKKSVWQPERKIGLLSGITQITLQMSAPCVMIDPDTKKELQKIEKDKPFTVDFTSMKSNAVEIRGANNLPLKDLQASINGRKYFGGVRVNKNKGTLTVINIVPVEEYLRGVVPEEMSISFSEEALKAQAVAARSFTLKNTGRHKNDGYDLCDSHHCQTYEGISSVAPSTDKAVLETRGEVLYYKGAAAMTNFHTDSGGMTESNANVWGTEIPYLHAVEELNKQTQPWTVTLTKTDFSERMGANFGSLQSITLSNLIIGRKAADRTDSGRVKFALVAGSKKTFKMTGIEMRQKFSLPSTLFNVKVQSGEIIFEGYGRGHGVGMSQYGAEAYAKSGWKYDQILKHYYKGTEIKKLY